MSLFKSLTDKVKASIHGTNGVSESAVLESLRIVKDPDLDQDIVTLGFVRNVRIDLKDNGSVVSLEINLTTPACPVKEQLKSQAEQAVKNIDGVSEVHIKMTASTRGRITPTNDATSAALSKVRNIIAVASGKGGVGKSTSAVNLAYALAKAGSKVGLMDADVYGPSIPLMTRPDGPTQSNSQLMNPPLAKDVKVMSIGLFAGGDKATIVRGPMASGVIKQFLTQVDWGELDYLVIDYPPGTGDIQLTLSQVAPITGAVVVTTPQDVALIDVRKAIGMFDTMKVPVLGVIETMSYFVCDGCDKRHEIFKNGGGTKIAKEFGIPLLGAIPIEAVVASSSDEGTPCVLTHPNSQSANAYTAAAGEVARQLSMIHEAYKDALTHFSFQWQ